MVLGEVAHFRRIGPLHLARIRRHRADQAIEQRGLADAVGADDGDTLAGFDLQAETVEQHVVAPRLGELVRRQCVTVDLLALLEPDERADTRGGLDLLELDLVDLALARGGLLGLGGVGREAADELLKLGDFRLLLGVVGVQALAGLGRGDHVLVIVAREQPQLAVIQIRHVSADAIQEVAIVGDDDHRRAARPQDLFQPADGVDIQMVGGLVEQQHVGVREQRLGQQHAQLPARRHHAHRLGVLLQRNAQPEQQLAGTGFGGVTLEFGEAHFQVGDLHAVLVAHLRLGIDALALRRDFPQLLVAHDHGIDHALVFERELILAQLAQPRGDVLHHLTAGRLQIAPQNLHEGGLAAAVGADQAVAMATAEFDGYVLEQRLGAKLHGDVGSREHSGESRGKRRE